MKTRTIVVTLISLISATVLVFQSCKKDKESNNQAPTCTITSPTNWQQLINGEIVTISVDATDSDGSITEVKFFIDNVDKGAAPNYPFNYIWYTNAESISMHKIKATSIDNNGGSTSDEVYVVIIWGGDTTNFTDTRDGQTYKIVTIGTQTWFAENLNYQTGDSWCYDNDSNNCDKYGRLYNWITATKACPGGWHLPSDIEWITLEMMLSMSKSEAKESGWRGTDEGKKLKSTTGWYSGGNGTDEVGFSALPGGYHGKYGIFQMLGHNGYWWSRTEGSSDDVAWYRYLDYNTGKVNRSGINKSFNLSVRCVKN